MAKEKQVAILLQGPEIWNKWRRENINIKIKLVEADLGGANLIDVDLSDADLRGANFFGACLCGADLSKANLQFANLEGVDLSDATLNCANLTGANLSLAYLYQSFLIKANICEANLSQACLQEAMLNDADIRDANLSEANLINADLSGADLSGADLSGANLSRTDFFRADLIGTKLIGANLSHAIFIEADLSRANLSESICIGTDLSYANIDNSKVYGISIWDIKKEDLKGNNLIITKDYQSVITVDNIEVAQFIYLILNSENLRNVIGTIAQKGVLILGRFTPERKSVLDAIREKLREYDLVPMMFDFEKVSSRDFTETIKVLAGMCRFVIADITSPKSSPLELQATIPDYKIPFLPIIQKGENPFSMFKDLTIYPWVLDLIEYDSEFDLLNGFKKGIIDRAFTEDARLIEEKNRNENPPKNIREFE